MAKANWAVVGAVYAATVLSACAAGPQGRTAEGYAPGQRGTDIVPAPLPAYDSKANCHQLGVAAGGSALVEATCRDQEVAAQAWLSTHTTTRHISGYCRGLGDAAGGLLNVIHYCIVQEEKAQARLNREG